MEQQLKNKTTYIFNILICDSDGEYPVSRLRCTLDDMGDYVENYIVEHNKSHPIWRRLYFKDGTIYRWYNWAKGLRLFKTISSSNIDDKDFTRWIEIREESEEMISNLINSEIIKLHDLGASFQQQLNDQENIISQLENLIKG